MGRKIRITEEQYNMALREGVTINADLSASNDDPKKAFDTAKTEAEKQGLKPGGYNIQFPSVNENKFLTKKELQESRLKKLKKNSELYTVKDFINKFNK
jgi:hypothetical protein